MAQIAYVDWDGLVYYDGKIKQYISDIADGCLKAGGKIPFAQLPRPSYDNLNYVYKITDSFTSTNDFDKPGFKYEAGALVQVEAPANSNTYRYTVIYEVIHADDLEQRVASLEDGAEEHTVDIGALSNSIDELYAMLGAEYAKKSDIPSIDGLASEQYVNEAVQGALENIAFDDKQVVENTAAIQSLNESVSSIEDGLQSIENNLDGALGGIEELIDDVSQLSEQIATKADGKHNHTLSDISDYAPVDLSPYAQKDWVEEQQYLTEHQSLEGYAKVSDIPTNVSAFINDAGYAKSSDVNEKLENKAHKSHSHSDYALRTEIPKKVSDLTNDSQFVTEFSLQNKGFLTEHQSLDGYAKSIEIPTKVSQLTNDSGYLTSVPDEYVTAAELAAKKYLSVIPSEYITSDELDAKGYLTRHQSLDGYAKLTDLPKIPTKVSAFTNDAKYATVDQLSTSIANIKFPEVDLSNYYTKDRLYTKAEVDSKINAIDGFAKESDIPTKVSQLVNDKGYLTSIPSEYVTDEELQAKKYLTAVPGEYITETELAAKGYLTQHQSLAGYAKVTDIPDVPSKISELQDDRGLATVDFVAASIANIDFPETDLSNYYTKDKVYNKLEVDQELNKKADVDDLPNFSTFATKSEVKKKLDASTYEEDRPHYALKTELFSGSYDDLTNKPSIPSIDGLASESFVKQQIAAAQFEGGQADVDLIEGYLSDYYKKGETYSRTQIDARIPSLDGYAKQQWVEQQQYLTASSDIIKGKANKSDIISDTIDLNNSAGFITENEALSAVAKVGYITDVSGKLDVETYESDKKFFALKSDIPSVDRFITAEDVPSYIPEEYVTNDEITNLVTREELEAVQNTAGQNSVKLFQLDSDLVDINAKLDTIPTKVSDLENDAGYITSTSLQGYATEQFVKDEIGAIDIPEVNLSDYYTKAEVEALIPTDYIKDVSNKLDVSVYNADKLYLATKDDLNAFENLIGYTPVDDRSFAEVIDDTFAKKTSIPSLDGYATEEFVNTAIQGIQIGGDVDLTNYYTKTEVDGLIERIEIPTVPTNISAFTNDAGYLTKHIDISGKLDTSVYNEEKAQFALASAIPTSVTQLDGIDGYATTLQLSSKADVAHTHSIDDIEGYEAPDYSDFYNKEDTEKLVEAAVGGIKTDADDKFALKSDLASLAERVGVIEESEVSVDLTDYYTKGEVDRLIPDTSNFITMGDVEDKGYLTEHQDISGKQDVLSFEGEYNANTNRVATKSYVDNALSSINLADVLSTKADNVPFNKPMIVTKPIGNLEQDEDLCGRTIAYILTKMLGLEEQPEHGEVTVEDVKEKSIPVMQGSANSSGDITVEDSPSSYGYIEFTGGDEANAPQSAETGTSLLYEVLDDDGAVIEQGYQIYSFAGTRGTKYRVAIAEGLTLKEVKYWDTFTSSWVDYEQTFTDTGERIEANGYTYVVYQSTDRCNEQTFRFVIE